MSALGRRARKQCTLVLLRRDGEVLLGMKLRGFGEGKWNGFGGKVEPGETVDAAAARELHEECGVRAGRLDRRGAIWFDWPDEERDGDGAHAMVRQGIEVHVYTGTDFSGEPAETEEMRPRWFAEEDIPFGSMWPDDRLWFPLLLGTDKSFVAYFLFSGTEEFLAHSVRPVGSAAVLLDDERRRAALEEAAAAAGQ